MIEILHQVANGVAAGGIAIGFLWAAKPWDSLAYVVGGAALAVSNAVNGSGDYPWAGFFGVCALGMLVRFVGGWGRERELRARKQLKKIAQRNGTEDDNG